MRRAIKLFYEQASLIVALALLGHVTFQIFNQINKVQPKPYMDEIFHVPQAQLYCQNIWNEWNPKITTLPGLYVVSYVFLKPLGIVIDDICTVNFLRFVNVLGTFINFLLIYKLMSKIHDPSGSKSFGRTSIHVLSALNITIFPPLYFFSFLYYTDVWSLTFVLLMYYEHLLSTTRSKFLACLSSLCAVLMRQTNIIWVGFLLLDDAWNTITRHSKSKKVQDYKSTIEILKSFQKNVAKSKKGKHKPSLLPLVKEIITRTSPHLVICILFVAFVLVNGSVVVGDREAHKAVFHPMQIFYFLDFTAFFAMPYFAFQVISKRNRPCVYVVILITSVAAILSELNKLEHPYLLADNRHFAFYIWRRIFGHDVFRRIVVPTYAVAAIVLSELLEHCNFMFRVCLAFSIALNLSFQHLFELRYYIIPFIMCRLQFNQSHWIWFETALFSLINALTIYIFINKSFHWPSEPEAEQRFIW